MPRRSPRPALRLVSLFLVTGFILVVLAGRLVQLQVVQAEPLEMRGAKQRVRRIELHAQRGSIFDRAMNPLAFSVEGRAIYANPRLVENPALEALKIAPVLGVPAADLAGKLAKETGFVYLARHVPLPVARRVEALELPYIGMQKETVRVYPADAVAGQVVGFVGVDDDGLSGIESSYDAVLRGRPGEEVIERDPNGMPIPQGRYSLREPVPGKSIVLSIDRDIQHAAEAALARGIADTGARDGVAVVMDPRTGDILAMANQPQLDPNRYTASTPDQQRNRVVTDAYEPGSVNKVITAAAAIEAGLTSPEEMLKLPSRIRIADKTFGDVVARPSKITYADALARSSNVASITVALRLGPQALYDSIRKFGLGSTTGIGFPGESPGIIAAPGEWSGTSMGTIPIGQGIAATPLQVASVYATIANDGVRVRPRLIRGFVEPDGTVRDAGLAPALRVVRPYTAAQVRGMLIGVVEHGTGQRAKIPGYLVAGKTGTARVPLANARGYSRDIITTFAGFAPADRPRFVVMVALNNPAARMAATTAAPIFREIMSFTLAHQRVPPTVAIRTVNGVPR